MLIIATAVLSTLAVLATRRQAKVTVELYKEHHQREELKAGLKRVAAQLEQQNPHQEVKAQVEQGLKRNKEALGEKYPELVKVVEETVRAHKPKARRKPRRNRKKKAQAKAI